MFNKLGCALVLCLFLNSAKTYGQFTAGNLVVLQAGDGSIALASSGNQIILREFNTLGASTFSVAVSPSVTPLIISGSASSEGGLSLTPNGKYLVFTGYATNLPYTSSLAGASATVVNRGIGIVDAAGGYTRAAVSNTFHSGNNIRAAASNGIGDYWSAGANDGTDYFGTSSPSVTIQNANVNTKGINIFGGNLLFSTGSGSTGIYQVSSGLPLTSGQTNSVIISTGSSSPFGFYFNSTMTTCYIGDDRSIASGGGIQKWVYSAGTWTLAYTLGTGVGSTVGARGVVVDFSGANPIVYATTAETSLDRLIAITDAGAGSTATTLATASANTIFRGLAFSPNCTSPQVTAINNNGPICAGQTLSLTPTTTGSGPLTYTWSGPGNFTSTAQNPILSGAQAGNYSLNIANACGNSSLSASVTVNPLPVLSVNSVTICSGGSVTLIANGAATYTWSTGSNSTAIVVSPPTNTIYIVRGSSSQGCIVSDTSFATLTNAPVISVNSATVCEGSTATLTASGVSSYTWSPSGPYTSVIYVFPPVTTIYTVNGTAAGCGVVVTNTAVVTVNPLPTVSVNSATICPGSSATLTSSGAGTYSWIGVGSGSLITVAPLVSTIYTVTGFSTAGCQNSTVATVFVNVAPSLFVTSAAVCAGNAATLSASGASTYSWNTTAMASLITVTPSSTTDYTVTGTSTLGCIGSAVATVTVNALPTVSLAAINSPLCLSNPSIGLSGTPAGGTYSGAGVSGNAFLPSVSMAGTFTIVYSYTNGSGCSNSDNKTVAVEICTGIQELSSTSLVSIYPNPATEELQINLENFSGGASTIDVYDVNALKIMTQQADPNTNKITLEVTALSKGVYYLRIQNASLRSVVKFIKD